MGCVPPGIRRDTKGSVWAGNKTPTQSVCQSLICHTHMGCETGHTQEPSSAYCHMLSPAHCTTVVWEHIAGANELGPESFIPEMTALCEHLPSLLFKMLFIGCDLQEHLDGRQLSAYTEALETMDVTVPAGHMALY